MRWFPVGRPTETVRAIELLKELGAPLLIHQPSYSLLNRWIEPELLSVLELEGVGCIGFSPLAQGMLTDKYLGTPPEDSRKRYGESLPDELFAEATMAKIAALKYIAGRRGQALPQMAIAWALRDSRMTSIVAGARTVEQLETNVAALDNLAFDMEELTEIDRYATDSGVNLWAV